MATALALQIDLAPAQAETINATMQQLQALAEVISEIDSYKQFAPSKLPSLLAQGRHAVATIWNNALFPLQSPAVEIASEQLEAFSDCLKCLQGAITAHQFDLLGPFIETAHDLITLMAGDKAVEIYHPEDEA
jgi:hypothetical protein